jgi:7-cyano-7-deazaguanine synthase
MSTSKLYRRALVVLSGGQDSTTCLYLAKTRLADEVHAVTFDYAQRHALEIGSAIKIAEHADIASHEVIQLGHDALHGTSPLVNRKVEVESYASAEVLPGGIEKTFVPMRNALFLTIAANRAAVRGCTAIVVGVSAEDYGGYPDCRPPFIEAMQAMVNAALAESVEEVPTILAPLMNLDKARTVKLAADLPGCMRAMAYTHTCYNGDFPPCGTCHACLLRAKGFELAGLPDPLVERAEAGIA